MEINIGPSWNAALSEEFEKSYFKMLTETVRVAYLERTVYPPQEFIFNAFTLCPFDQVQVVILGQDPYHGAGQAHGLSFSVPEGIKTPPSLHNIYKEIKTDLGMEIPEAGNLERWAKQGVLLLNVTLTVEQDRPGSHQHLGWETFTDATIKTISEQKNNVVFMLWGRYAQAKVNLIDPTRHLILKSPHPSPLSAHRGFLGCRHFSKTNEYLRRGGLKPIEW